jgi:hypothetical protein
MDFVEDSNLFLYFFLRDVGSSSDGHKGIFNGGLEAILDDAIRLRFDRKGWHGNYLGFDIKMPYGVATQQKIGEIITNTTMMLHWKVSYYYYSMILMFNGSIQIPNDLILIPKVSYYCPNDGETQRVSVLAGTHTTICGY